MTCADVLLPEKHCHILSAPTCWQIDFLSKNLCQVVLQWKLVFHIITWVTKRKKVKLYWVEDILQVQLAYLQAHISYYRQLKITTDAISWFQDANSCHSIVKKSRLQLRTKKVMWYKVTNLWTIMCWLWEHHN